MPWWRGWGPLVVLPAVALAFAPRAWPRWALMWVLAAAIYAGCKWLTWRRTPVAGATGSRHLGYLFLWPGMDAAAFLDASRPGVVERPPAREWTAAAVKLLLGLALLCGAARALPPHRPYLVGWAGMIGLALALHFGLFHLLSCLWRSRGVAARRLMDRPLAAAGVAEFWGRRWNRAFRDLTHRFLFRPLVAALGPARATLVGFGASGLAHELVISLPARGGWGGPTLFFLVQGSAILAERSALGRALGLERSWRGRLFTLAVLIAPATVLFHPPFVVRVVVPFLGAIGAIGALG